MSYIVKRENKKGESLNYELSGISTAAVKIAGHTKDFEYFERTGSIQVWLDLNRERARKILARLDKIESEFIETIED